MAKVKMTQVCVGSSARLKRPCKNWRTGHEGVVYQDLPDQRGQKMVMFGDAGLKSAAPVPVVDLTVGECGTTGP